MEDLGVLGVGGSGWTNDTKDGRRSRSELR
jgi:hypothetical protein